MATSADLADALRVERAAPDERAVIANLAQLYTYDLDRYLGARAEREILADGRYPVLPYLDTYWREEGRFPYLLRVGGVVAGFALVNRHFRLEPPGDWAMAEFFVHRRFQRRGMGRAAAHRLFVAHKGRRELSTLRANLISHGFWRTTIEGHAGVRDVAVVDGRDGPLYRFTTP